MKRAPTPVPLTRPCSACGRPFTSVHTYGRIRERCDEHRRINRPYIKRSGNDFLLPSTGYAVTRSCLTCHAPFVARLPSALYCGLVCFLSQRILPKRKFA